MEVMWGHDKSSLGGVVWTGTAWSVLRRGCGNASDYNHCLQSILL